MTNDPHAPAGTGEMPTIIELTGEERGAVVMAMCHWMHWNHQSPFIHEQPELNRWEERKRRITFEAYQKLIGRHHSQMQADYQI